MGKKNETDSREPAIAERPATKNTASEEPETKTASPGTNSDGAPAKAVKKAPKKTAAKKRPGFSTEDIALRAYFISENRHKHGIHGDAHSDWIEAERQLRAEKLKKAAKKTAKTRKKAGKLSGQKSRLAGDSPANGD